MKNTKDLLNYNNIFQTLEAEKKRQRRKIKRAVYDDAIDLLENLKESGYHIETFKDIKKALLNGARDWKQYSYGGCTLIYDQDIAEHYLTKKEQKINKDGIQLLNLQARCLEYAARICSQAISIEWQRLGLPF